MVAAAKQPRVFWLFYAVIVAAIPFLAVLANYAFLLSSNSYLYSLAATTATPENALPRIVPETAAAASKDVIAYVKGAESELQYASYFRPEELSHLADVRAVMSASFTLIYFLAAVIAALMVGLFVASRNVAAFVFALRRTLFLSGIATVAVVIVLFLASLSFEFSFVTFHKILFNSSQWQFPSGYLLVNLFTEAFFAKFSRDVVLATLIQGILLLAAAVLIGRFYNMNNNAKKKGSKA